MYTATKSFERFRQPKSVEDEKKSVDNAVPKSTVYKTSLNYWLSKFVQEVSNSSGERCPYRLLYSIICGLKRYLSDVYGSAALNR